MTVLINKMLLFLALMALGYLGARRGRLSPAFTKDASWLAINVFMVATILYSAMGDAGDVTLAETGQVLLVFTGAMLLGYAVAFALTRLLRIPEDKAPVFELLIAVMNPLYIGLPVVQLLYGQRAVLYMAINNLPFNFLLFSYGAWRLRGGGSGEKSAVRWRDMLSAPMIATLLSLLIFLLRIPIPAAVRDLTGTISGATIPLSMVVIGSSLGRVRLVEAFTEKELYLVTAVRLVLLPLLAWLLLPLVTGNELLRNTVFITCACPSAIMISILCIQYGKDAAYSSKGILLDTLLSIATIPALVALLL